MSEVKLQDGATAQLAVVTPNGALKVDANFPATQPVSGAVSVTNFPGTQDVSGAVAVTNFPPTQPVSGSVAVTNLPATQPVSAATLPLPTGAATEATLAALLGRL